MIFNPTTTKLLAVYNFDIYSIKQTKNVYQMFGTVVLDLSENCLVRSVAENSKSASVNSSLKAALYFYICSAKKAYCNYKAVKAGINYSFKLKINNFNGVFAFQVKLLTEHTASFVATKSLIAGADRLNFYSRRGAVLDGVSLTESNDLFQNLYKDIRPKFFNVAAKFAKTFVAL